ncbi:hypothetical protein J6590_017718 [Homalodisca vitripennis]|nr:hypothetical protein J6590_017718 [Homalodisca vitripennis]
MSTRKLLTLGPRRRRVCRQSRAESLRMRQLINSPSLSLSNEASGRNVLSVASSGFSAGSLLSSSGSFCPSCLDVWEAIDIERVMTTRRKMDEDETGAAVNPGATGGDGPDHLSARTS